MTTEEVIGFADSVGRMYYVNVNINRDYLESHPLLRGVGLIVDIT